MVIRGSNPFHPGVKVAATLVVVAGTLAATTPGGLLPGVFAAAVSLAMTPGAALRFGRLLRRLRWVAVFVVVLHGWLSDGIRVFPGLGPWSPHQQGLATAGHLLGVLGLTTALAAALMGSTRPAVLAGGINWLFHPLQSLGLPVERFARLLAWTVERIEPVGREVAAVRDALRLRRYGSGLGERLRLEARAARRILGRAEEAAERNAEALYLHGGGGVEVPSPPEARDWALLAVALGLMAAGRLF